MSEIIAKTIIVKGLVQGIGYRPFVTRTAEKYQIRGWVKNTDGIVTILATGERSRMEQFLSVLYESKPKGAWIAEIEVSDTTVEEYEAFTIADSDKTSRDGEVPYIPADLPTCDICSRQLKTVGNRRYRYPFISCTACGPRYSIIEKLPYDRDTITMSDFGMCKDCGREYVRKNGIRRHAQTIACGDCGPVLKYLSYENVQTKISSDCELSMPKNGLREKAAGDEALLKAVSCINNGGIIAIKDIGGFHLSCSPYDSRAVDALRLIKGREKKPFAVMFRDMASVRKLCEVNREEAEQLLSAPRPIVLLKRKTKGGLADNVCGNSTYIGAMLPCNPLQQLLLEETEALVMTSANRSGELIITENEKMHCWMDMARDMIQSSLTDCPNMELGILEHDRRILTPLDDSIVRVSGGFRQVLRRARGMVPLPVKMPAVSRNAKTVFAAGGDLKSSFCYTAGNWAYLSQHLGDLEEEECFLQYEKETEHMEKLFGFKAIYGVSDFHLNYISVKRVNRLWENSDRMFLQHHMAHVMSVIAEHGLEGKVFGVAFDGTGMGLDGTIWGSEFFIWDGADMKRLAHLSPVQLIGGNEGTRNTDGILCGYFASFGTEFEELLEDSWSYLPKGLKEKYKLIQKAVKYGVNNVTTSSMGRLFDAVAALLQVCHYNEYEGEAPTELEYLACGADVSYPLRIRIKKDEVCDRYVGDVRELFEDFIHAVKCGVEKEKLALGFIHAVADYVCQTCLILQKEAAGEQMLRQVALSGGCFLNKLLLEETARLLRKAGFFVYVNEQVPPGDGGICLGQAYAAIKYFKNHNYEGNE